MATHESIRRVREEKEEAERRNPLLKLSLGELVMGMQRISSMDKNVFLPEEKVPEGSRENYRSYNSLIKELNNREARYNSYKEPPRY
ncbi:MAG TPA: hypothetical protein VJZ93_00305 [Candidatus Nanoarchaeia archaeon]|nr:hypothetical protein [Candidatus Nanoarchaeia archaeon]